MRARKTAGMLRVGAGARREANKHQLQAGYSLQMMSFGHVWAIDVTILCFSNDAHVGHQLRISLLWHHLSVVLRRSHFVVVLALAISSSFSPCRLSLFLLFAVSPLCSGCDAGQLGLNQNQIDTVSKLSKRV